MNENIYGHIFSKMQNKYTELAGFTPDESSDINIRLMVLAEELSRLYSDNEVLERQLFPQSSSGKHLDRHGELWGINRKNATFAMGYAVFSRTVAATVNLAIPIETVIAVSTVPAKFFITTAPAYILAGEKSVKVPIRAQEAGIGSNVAANMINTIVSSVTSISSVTNPDAITGANEIESDDALRQRILARYQKPSTSSNAGFYYNYAIAHPNVAFARVMPQKSGTGTANVIIMPIDSNKASGTINELLQYYNMHREICNTVAVQSASIKKIDISLSLAIKDKFTFDDVRLNCEHAVGKYLSTMDIGSNLLINHLGRVILNVEGVLDYKFSAPNVDIIVKDNEVVRLGSINITLAGA